jgi:hypothetical protein
MLVFPRMTAETKGTLGWERRCIRALAAARRSASPSESLYRLLGDGCLDNTEAHHTLGNEPPTEPCHISICGVQINDETFEREYKAVIERLCLSLLWQLVKEHKTMTGVALTMLARDLSEALDSTPDKTALEVVHAMMSKLCPPSSIVTAGRRHFTYRPLPQDGASIRLLGLLPSGSSDRLSCELVEQSLLARPKYEALSYVWGDTKEIVNIFVDGQAFPVNTNLYEALKALRKSNERRVLWADAICIDQANLTERSSQVAMMGTLYRQAATVIAWLGSEAEDQEIVLQTLNGDRNESEDFRIAIFDFLNNAYFQRAWIVQEIMLSPNVVLQSGASTCPLEKLQNYLLDKFDKKDVTIKQDYANAPTRRPFKFYDFRSIEQSYLVLGMRRRVYWRGVLLTNDNQDIFGDLFVITGNTVCLDPKDKVRNEPLDVGFENDYRSLRVRGFEIDEIDCGVHIDFSTKYAFVQSVLACIELCHHSLDWHSCARAASWLAILYIVDPFQYHSYHISRASIDAAAQSDPLDPANFPPRTLDAASRLAETYWVWHGDDSSDLSRSMHSTIRRSIRKEGVFTTKNGSYVAATAMANKGDIVVAFPRTFCLLALRKVGGHRFVVGPV